MTQQAQEIHEPGVDVVTVPAAQADAKSDAIADANAKQGVLTLVTHEPQPDGTVKLTCVGFTTEPQEEGQAPPPIQQAATPQAVRDQATIATPREGSAPAESDF